MMERRGSKQREEVVGKHEQKLLGLLRVKVLRGVNLAIRDRSSSDPYVVIKMDRHKLKTHVVKKNVNPQWNEELTLPVVDPTHPIKVEVYDKDTFSFDDPMGDAEIDIKPFIEAVSLPLQDIPNKTIIKKLIPSRSNSLAEASPIYVFDGKVLQDIVLRLRHVETGEVEIQLQWVSVPNSRGV